ncbi:ABC transporter ATP-binding protein [Diplocloster modestus]|uniref:ABC transporter ATP-binding protein/permease n=1 Tax=Diplocloster modestus TaxID=2850322 RepID=A0ABS6KAG0_9FIRM|nr:ABC transporter ATP-binding protein [Diplocloster modestus]MBU9727491.1 ABC transporter ATP-binding protein/permease [Diplocloster modestus]
MTKLFKYLRDVKGMVVLIIALLVIQAYCDLALPQYTSNIVDVGIQQGGIEYVAPEKMRPETFENLSCFLNDAQIKILSASYDQDADGNYVLNTKNKEALEQLDEMLGTPMMLISSVEESGKMTMESLKGMIASGQMTKDQVMKMKDQALSQMGDLQESLITQKAILFVKAEYEALGIDMGAYQTHYLLKSGGIMLLYTLVMVIAAILAGMLGSYSAAKIGRNLRSRMFQKVVDFSGNELDHFSTASLITRSTNDIQQVQMTTVMMLRFVIYAPILGIGGIIKVAGTRTGMGWIIGVSVGASILLVAVLMSAAMPKFKKMQLLVDKLNLVSREILTGLPVIRAFSRERFEEKRFEKANKDLMSTQLFTNRIMTFMMPAMMLVMNCTTVLIVWVGAQGINLGNLQVGDMMAFITYTMQIIMSFLMITMMSVMLPRAGVAAVRIDEVMQTSCSIQDKEKNQDEKLAGCRGVLTFEDVSFHYPGAQENTLHHLSFTAKPGKTTAIIGSTGCGKSTLIHLIPRFYDVTGGRITLDGVDIRDLSQHKLRELLGFVPQKGMLFSGNIESNIKFAGEDTITDEAMIQAAGIAQAVEFIDSKPEQYKSRISEGGTNVSGGQKQRLSIARAIAKNPKVFLFDDSFSALDYKTDVVLRKALNEKVQDATVIIVAQRISTILHADQIIVLDEGRIVGMGNHEDLLENCETYQEIAKSQLSEKELKGGRAS